MHCNLCHHPKTKTLETRTHNDPDHDYFFVQRKHRCLNDECNRVFYTVELDTDLYLPLRYPNNNPWNITINN